MDQKINSTLAQAEKHITEARNLLCKPEEDVVPYGVCKSAHQAIVNYLMAYLMRNGRDIPDTHTVENMLTYCREIDSKFNELHLAPFYHPTETEDIWMNLDTATDFLKMAETTKSLVLELANQNNR